MNIVLDKKLAASSLSSRIDRDFAPQSIWQMRHNHAHTTLVSR
jgi:hypothetical protein